MKLAITKKLQDRWEVAKAQFNKDIPSYETFENPIVGKLWWQRPSDVLWLWSTNREEDYGGSQTQIGVKKDGTVMWGFHSHCSCNGYYDDECPSTLKDFVNQEETFKQYEFNEVTDEVVPIITKRLAQISAALK